MRETIIAPSILSADFSKLGAEIESLRNAGCKRIHVDVMDGVFVPNISFGCPVVKQVRKMFPDMIFDAHLMITDPIKYVEDFAKIGSDIIIVHIESQSGNRECLEKIHSLGRKAGISIKPKTPAEAILPLSGHLATPEDISALHSWDGGANGIWRVQARNAAKPP